MARWEVSDDLELVLRGVGRAMVRIDGGSVRIEEGGDATRCEIRRVSGGPVDVSLDGATLRVMHPAPTWDGSPQPGDAEAEIVLRVPTDIELDVHTARGIVAEAEPLRVAS